MAIIPDLRAQRQGREVLLAYERDIGDGLKFACDANADSNTMVLAKAAQIVLLRKQDKFTGTFKKDCQQMSVSKALLALVQMILEGPNIMHQSETYKEEKQGRGNIALVISQLLIFNSITHNSTATRVHHNIDRETPLPIYLGLMVHTATRKRNIVDKLHNLGLPISYDRLLQISTDMANTVCARYNEVKVVCPPSSSSQLYPYLGSPFLMSLLQELLSWAISSCNCLSTKHEKICVYNSSC